MTTTTMLGAVQLGAAAACVVVVLIPMVMAGWHLSRNRILLYCGVLFITLAVCLHLTPISLPFLISLPQFLPLLFLITVVRASIWLTTLHGRSNPMSLSTISTPPTMSHRLSICMRSVGIGPNPPSMTPATFKKLSKSDASDLLNGSWVVVAGDSQARFFTLSLLNLILGPQAKRMGSVRADLFNRHSDYSIFVHEIGMKLDFVWAPSVVNLTNSMMGFKTKKSYPDVMVMGAGLWHMLHVNNASNYDFALRMLKSSVVSLLPLAASASIKSSHLFWLGMPMLINGMLNTQEKREKMSDRIWHAYDRALGDSRLLRQTGGPLVLLDIQSLTWNCGPRCTSDGMHYDLVIYEAAVQVMLNALLIESHQSL